MDTTSTAAEKKDRLRLLFVCTANHDRSPTAETLYRQYPAYEVRSCGIHPMATVPMSASLIEWADVIICMEGHHANAILDQLPDAVGDTKIVVLGIPDAFPRNDPRLIDLIRTRMDEIGLSGER